MRGQTWMVGGALVASMMAACPAWAADPREEAFDLATVEADHDICQFPLTDEQQDVIAQRRDALVTRGDISADELAAVTSQVATALQRQKNDGLCRADGAEARSYQRRLSSLGLL